MGTHWTIFLTIGNLVSSSSSLFAGVIRGRTWPAPCERMICPVSAVRESRAVKPWDLSSRSSTREISYSQARRQLDAARTAWAAFFAGPATGSSLSSFFGSNPVLDIFSVFAAALKIQLMSPASDLFSQWFSQSNHCNLPWLSGRGPGADRPPYVRCGLLSVR
jgi:hypothetical protein